MSEQYCECGHSEHAHPFRRGCHALAGYCQCSSFLDRERVVSRADHLAALESLRERAAKAAEDTAITRDTLANRIRALPLEEP